MESQGSSTDARRAAATASERRERLHAELERSFGPAGPHAPLGARIEAGIEMPVLDVEPRALHGVLEALRGDPALQFDQMSYLTATDELPEEPRFRLAYFLASTARLTRVKVRTRVAEGGSVRSAVPLFLGANWMEREVFDMFGIGFEGHPECKRILMPEGYRWHPLRKDFPLEGIEPDRLYREWERAKDGSAREGAP